VGSPQEHRLGQNSVTGDMSPLHEEGRWVDSCTVLNLAHEGGPRAPRTADPITAAAGLQASLGCTPSSTLGMV
jgi:hypothetical protein